MTLLDRLGQSITAQVALLLGVGILLYGQSLGFGYVWDDGIIFLDKNSLMVEPLSWKLLSEPFLEKMSYMRPLVMLSWWAEFHLFGQNPIVSHAINVTIYLCNVLLVRALALQLLRARQQDGRATLWASLAALLYAIHPALIESAAWVSGRFDLLCTLGMLAASVIFLRTGLRPAIRLPALLFFTAVALMSKELGVVLPGILLCCWMAANAGNGQSLWRSLRAAVATQRSTWIGLIALMAAYFISRRFSIGGVYETPWGLEYLHVLADTWLPLKALVMYSALAVLPFGRVGIMHPLTDFPTDGMFWLYALLACFAVLFTLYHALRRQRAWAWVLLAGYVSIALVLHFIPMTINVNITQDRFMTAPLAFCCISLVLFMRELNVEERGGVWRVLRPASIAVLSGWMVASLVVVASLIPLWNNPLSLWGWAIRQHPETPIVVYNYLEAAISAGRTDLANAEFDRLKIRNDGLEVDQQILYANLLLRSADPEAVNYLEGVLYALPKFHDMPDGKAFVDIHVLSSTQIAAAYSDYAFAKLLFEHDPSAALEYNRIARWYLNAGAHLYLDYTNAAFLYCAGRLDEADVLMRRIDPIYHYGKEAMRRQVRSLVRAYCSEAKKPDGSRPPACFELESRGFFDQGNG